MNRPLRSAPKLLLAAAALAVSASALLAQPAAEAVLFTVDGTPVSVGEFDYIYAKTNGDTADYSRASLEEYLDLYRRFKLKVAKARDMGLDTVPALNQELAGYRRQLADSYLVDEEVTEPLARQLWERKQEDVRVLHIAVDLPPAGQDTSVAYAAIAAARDRVTAGEMWARVAKEVSSDPSAKRNGGEVGYVTAPLPDGLYALENAVYATPVGKTSPIVRSDRAYHIIQVLDRRPARGEVEAAHIFLRKPKGDEAGQAAVRARIDSIYAALEAGGDFEALAQALSEDSRSAQRGGYVGFFGINRYALPLEDAAFGIVEDGAYAEPVETAVGYHIVKRIGRRDAGEWDAVRPELMQRVKRMPRFQAGRAAMVGRLQDAYGFAENVPAVNRYIASLPDTFLNYRWRPGPVDEVTLFAFGDGDPEGIVKLSDFTEFLRRNASRRIRMEGQMSVPDAARSLYDDFKKDQTLVYAERRLDTDNPAFYNLMREYREGILLFEATKQNVWDRAGLDTVGLEAFFAEHRDDYRWKRRVALDIYSIPLENKDTGLYLDVLKYAKKHTPEEVLAKFNVDGVEMVEHHERIVERGSDPGIDRMSWKPGTNTPPETDTRRRKYRVGVVREVLEPTRKELSEARGYVIADYQDELERRWVAELEREYDVEINREAFDALVRVP